MKSREFKKGKGFAEIHDMNNKSLRKVIYEFAEEYAELKTKELQEVVKMQAIRIEELKKQL